ncbi:MAG: Smr/MutS family protein, partial [Pontixanthobacter sp.]
MKIPRGLTVDEEAAWARLASSVHPLEGRKHPEVMPVQQEAPAALKKPLKKAIFPVPTPKTAPRPVPKMARRIGQNNLDSTWDRKLKAGSIAPDFTLDLHDHFLDAAHDRLDSGMHQARAMGARLVLVITGRSRPVEAADRASNRGVIRAKLLDWLAAGDHGDAIAAVRKA